MLIKEYEDEPLWYPQSKCRGVSDAHLYFYSEDKNGGVTKAKKICWGLDGKGECPVRRLCLSYALFNDEKFGVWGGTSERERRRIKRRRRARKRKPAVQAVKIYRPSTEQEINISA